MSQEWEAWADKYVAVDKADLVAKAREAAAQTVLKPPVPEEFLPFFGNNHNRVKGKVERGGGVSFKKHLGQPLTLRLWEDLAERLCIKGLRIYLPNDYRWLDGRSCSADIEIDKEGLVTEIIYFP